MSVMGLSFPCLTLISPVSAGEGCRVSLQRSAQVETHLLYFRKKTSNKLFVAFSAKMARKF